MDWERSMRTRRPREEHTRTLGKSLSHHQVLPAIQAIAANTPLTDIGKALSGTGGHPLISAASKVISQGVGQVSPFDSRMIAAGNLLAHLKYTPQAKSLSSQ